MTTEDNTRSDVLRWDTWKSVKNDSCLTVLKPSYRKFITPDKFCAAGVTGKTTELWYLHKLTDAFWLLSSEKYSAPVHKRDCICTTKVHGRVKKPLNSAGKGREPKRDDVFQALCIWMRCVSIITQRITPLKILLCNWLFTNLAIR